MRYCWISISQLPGAHNYGNRLIEHSLRRLFSFEGDELSIDVYKVPTDDEIREVESCAFAILPGCTTIQNKEHPAMERLRLARVPMFCFGGAFFTRLVLPSARYCRSLQRPVGARDPFTHRHLKLYGIESEFIGCPTMFAGDATDWELRSGPVVFNFGRKDLRAQSQVFNRIRERHPVKVVIQEASQRDWVPNGVEMVAFDDIDAVLEAYRTASVVVTGRLHGALPALAYGTPVVFSQLVKDSRLSLLRHLGLRIFNPYDPRLVGQVLQITEGRTLPSRKILQRLGKLKERYRAYVDRFEGWARSTAADASAAGATAAGASAVR